VSVPRREIEAIVFDELRTWVPRGAALDLDARVISDLGVDSDDATAMALSLERRLGVRVERSRWRTVLTVRDMADALDEALRNPASTTLSASLWERLTSRWR
jgi:acyl carrier protein